MKWKITIILVFGISLIVLSLLSITSESVCYGYLHEGNCYETGEELAIEGVLYYVDIDGELIGQKGDGAECQNNFECLNNLCSNGECVNRYGEVKKAGEQVREIEEESENFFKENQKDLSKYGDKEIFLISDKNWRDVLMLVPLTTWTSQEGVDESECKKGYGTPDDICVYPTLVWHEEETGFDIDSSIYFMQQYSTDKVTIVGDTPQELDDLLVVEPELGVGLDVSQIQRINTENYLSYWESFREVVYVEDNYELALLASTYASLINAPLIIQGAVLDDSVVFTNRDVICVGDVNPSGSSCSEQYDLEGLQQKYIDMTNTDKIILINPNDLDIKVEEEFGPEKSSGSIDYLHTKNSLVSPFLASAKNEIILEVKEDNIISINLELERQLRNFFIDILECDLGDSCSSGFTQKSVSAYVTSEDTLVYDISSVLDSHSIYQIRFAGTFVNCIDEEVFVKIYNNNYLIGRGIYGCHTNSSLYLRVYGGERFDKNTELRNTKNAFIEPNLIKMEFIGGDYVISEKEPSLTLYGSNQFECAVNDGSCFLSEFERESFNVQISNGISYYDFNGLNMGKEYYLSYKIEKEIYSEEQNFKIYINGNEFIDDDYLSDTIINEIKIPPNLLMENMQIKIEGSTEYSAEIKLIPQSNDLSLTVVSSPNAIPFKITRGTMDYFEPNGNIVSLDANKYADISGDLYPDLMFGRIMGFTTSDVSSLIARSLFYNNDKMNIKFINGKDGDFGYSSSQAQIMRDLGYNAIAIKLFGDGYYGLDPMEWKDQDVIFYLDHGSGSWAGIHYNEIPKLKNSIILNHACSTASLDDSISFSLNSIRQGAIAHVGAVKISSFNAPYPNIFSDIFKSDNELGKSVLYSYDKIMPEISLIGDPTFKLNPPHMLNE